MKNQDAEFELFNQGFSAQEAEDLVLLSKQASTIQKNEFYPGLTRKEAMRLQFVQSQLEEEKVLAEVNALPTPLQEAMQRHLNQENGLQVMRSVHESWTEIYQGLVLGKRSLLNPLPHLRPQRNRVESTKVTLDYSYMPQGRVIEVKTQVYNGDLPVEITLSAPFQRGVTMSYMEADARHSQEITFHAVTSENAYTETSHLVAKQLSAAADIYRGVSSQTGQSVSKPQTRGR